jgi:uncharacterized protein (DUF362 family)
MGMASSTTVSVRHCPNGEQLPHIMNQLAEDTELRVPDGARVVVKPNLNDLKGPESGLTTDVRVVDALVRYLISHANPNKIMIVESDSWCRLADEAFDMLGYRELESISPKVKLVNLTKMSTLDVQLPFPSYIKSVRLPRLFMETDFFISVAKLRTHHTVISCILKNQFGCVPRRFKGRYHPYLNNILTNLNLLLRPDWCVVDGIVGADVGPREVDLMLASSDPVAIDSVCARIMGFNPERIPHIKAAAKQSVGFMENIRVLFDGDADADIGSIMTPFTGPNHVSLVFSGLSGRTARAADRLHNTASTLQVISGLSAGLTAKPKAEVLRRLLKRRTIAYAYRALKSGEVQA